MTDADPAAGSSPARRRLLILTPFAPRLDAPHGGGRSIAQLVWRLADRHDVALLSIRADDDPPVDDLLRRRCELVEEFVRRGAGRTRRQRWSRRARLTYALAAGRPMWVADNSLENFARRAREVAAAWRPDIVQLEFHVMAQYASAVKEGGAPVVLTQHESGSAAAHEQRAAGGGATLLHRLDELAWRRYEQHLVDSVDVVVAFGTRDRGELLRVRPDARVVLIPLATDIPPLPLSPAGAEPPGILFVGNFMHPPNVDAAGRLMSDIYPTVERLCPTAVLTIVGPDPPRRLTMHARERVVVTGRVDDVTPFLDDAAVIAVPIRLGGGMRVKVLEALAAGKAVVASRRALDGLGVVNGEHVLVAETDAEFAEAIAGLLRDREHRVALAARAREWASAHLGWERSIEAYEALYESVLEIRRSSPDGEAC